MIPTPTIRQFQFLLALSETKNFRKAAEKCFVTQPTLTSAIQEMEKILGMNVLNRHNRKKVVFTPFGEETITVARQVIEEVETLTRRASQIAEPLSGPVRMGIIPTIAPYLLPDILPHLQHAFPNLEYKIVEDMSANLINKLNTQEIDFAVLAFPYPTKDLHTVTFFEEVFCCAAPKDTYGEERTLTLKELEAQRILLLEDGHCLRDHAMSACQLQSPQDEDSLSATSLTTLIQMVAQGYGITLLPEMAADRRYLPKSIALHGLQQPKPTRTIGAAWPKSLPNDYNVLMSLQKIKEIFDPDYPRNLEPGTF